MLLIKKTEWGSLGNMGRPIGDGQAAGAGKAEGKGCGDGKTPVDGEAKEKGYPGLFSISNRYRNFETWGLVKRL